MVNIITALFYGQEVMSLTGVEEFQKLFGSITVTDLIVIGMALTFMSAIYKNIKHYIDKRYEIKLKREEADKLRDKQLKTALEAISQYPKYREQSIQIQQTLENKIESLRKSQDENTKKLQIIEETQRTMKETQEIRDRNKLRNIIIQSYKYYTDESRNPDKVISRMDRDTFFALVRDYEDAGGNDYVHSTVLPAMNALRIVEMNEIFDGNDNQHEYRK